MTTKTPRPKIKRRTPDQVKKLLIKQGKFKEETRGRKSHRPSERDKEFVRMLAAMNVSQDDIATKMGISDDTLRKHYKSELEDGRIDANASIGQTLFQQAKNGNTSAAIFWLKTRAGWKETNVTEITGEDGGPIKGLEVYFVAPKEIKPSE